jgi:beta-lactamase class A
MNRTLRLAALMPALLTVSLGSVTLARTTQAAPTLTPQAALTRLALAPKLDPKWFTPEFAGALPQVQGGFQGFASQYGAFQGVDALGNNAYRLRYATGTVTLSAQLNAAGQFSSLFLTGQQASAAAAAPPAPATPAPTTPASAATSTAAASAALDRLFRAAAPQAEWFTPEFLKAAPIASLSRTLNLLRQGLGAFQGVSRDAKTLNFAQGKLPVNGVSVDAQGRIASFFVGAPVLNSTAPRPSLQSAVDAFKTLPGQVSVVATENGKLLGSLNPEAKLAVGSTFKLGILAQLQDQIKAGTHAWTEVVTLQPGDKALPSGFLQTWPDGSPLTLQSLATLMISQSDNTATNVLLRVAGRDGVGQKLGLGAVPSTRDLFALKNPANKALKDAYLGGDDTKKKGVLAQAAAAPLPPVSLFDNDALVSPEIEWFVSAARLCSLMNEVAALPLTQITSGVADPAQFRAVSYKGGSEGGVLNATTQVTTQSGRSVCLSVTWNNAAPLDQGQFVALYTGLLQALK